MGKSNKFEQVIRSMKSVLDIPLTVKMRTGLMEHKNIAHNLAPKMHSLGVSLLTVSLLNFPNIPCHAELNTGAGIHKDT